MIYRSITKYNPVYDDFSPQMLSYSDWLKLGFENGANYDASRCSVASIHARCRSRAMRSARDSGFRLFECLLLESGKIGSSRSWPRFTSQSHFEFDHKILEVRAHLSS